MDEFLYEHAVEILELLISALGAVLFTIGGVVMEQAGLSNVAEGAMAVGAWEIAMGGLFLFVGVYLLGYQRFWQRLRLRLA